MKAINNEVIEAVRSRANILEVVSEVVVLKRVGKDYKGLCPFHKEKTPSFYVNPDKGIFKCFGCGEGGDVFTFVQKAKGYDFLEGVRQLANQYGVTLIETEEEKTEHKKRSFFLLLYEQACQFYAKLLKDPTQGTIARQYLASRGINETMVEKFRLGYAPPGWDGLINYLSTSHKVAASTLAEAGLARHRTEGSGYFDLFRHRLIIPIADEQGRVIAFGGRTLGDDQVKYLNSPETLIYKKGDHLFAFPLAREAIKAQDSVIVVEGYFDAITAHVNGFNNTVATLGTALSNEQGKLLVRHTESKRVYLAFDADSAGARAIEKGAHTLEELASGVGIDLRVIRLTGGKDPDECLRAENGAALFKGALENSQPLLEYELDQALADCDSKTRDGRIEAAGKAVPILARIKNAVARSEYIRQLASKLDIREESLLSDVAGAQRKVKAAAYYSISEHSDAKVKDQKTPVRNGRQMADGLVEAERWLIAAFLSDKTDYDLAFQALAQEELITSTHSRIIKAIYELGDNFNDVEQLGNKLLNYFAAEPPVSAALVDILLKAEEIKKQKIPVSVLLLQSRVKLVKGRIAALTKKLRDQLTVVDKSDKNNLFQSKISELSRLERITLPTMNTMNEIDAIKQKIAEINLELVM